MAQAKSVVEKVNKFRVHWMDRFRADLPWRGDLREANAAVAQHGRSMLDADKLVKGLGKDAAIPEATAKTVAEANRVFNNSAHNLNFARGKLGAGIKEMWRSFAGVFGADTSKWGSTVIRGDTTTAVQRALTTHAGIAERIVSKPFRIAANNPKTAIGALVLGGIVLTGTAIHNGAKKRSEHEYETAAAKTYQISAQDYALLQSRMRDGGRSGGFAAAEATRREAAQASNAVS